MPLTVMPYVCGITTDDDLQAITQEHLLNGRHSLARTCSEYEHTSYAENTLAWQGTFLEG
jgi:hypothetical protein